MLFYRSVRTFRSTEQVSVHDLSLKKDNNNSYMLKLKPKLSCVRLSCWDKMLQGIVSSFFDEFPSFCSEAWAIWVLGGGSLNRGPYSGTMLRLNLEFLFNLTRSKGPRQLATG